MKSMRKPIYKRVWRRKQLKGRGDADRDITFGQEEKPDVDLNNPVKSENEVITDIINVVNFVKNGLPQQHPYVSERTLRNGSKLPSTITVTFQGTGAQGKPYQKQLYLTKEQSPDASKHAASNTDPNIRATADWLAKNKWLTDLVGTTNTALNAEGDTTDYGTPPGLYFEGLTQEGQPDVDSFYKYGLPLECAAMFPDGSVKTYKAPVTQKGRAGYYKLLECKRDLAREWGNYDRELNDAATETARIRNLDDAELANAANIRADKGLPNTNRYAFVRAYGMRAERARDFMDNGQWNFFTNLSRQTGNPVDLIVTHMKVALDNPDAMANMEPNGTTEQGPFFPNPKVITPEMQAERDADAAFKAKYGYSKAEARGLLDRGLFNYFTDSGFDVDEVSAAL